MHRLLVALACGLLALQALPYFQNRWVEDESWYSTPAATLVRTGELRNPAMPATDYESHLDTRPPLMPLSLALSFRIFGSTVAAARLGEFLAAILTLFVVYAIGRELGNPLAGSLAAVLVACDNFFVLAARSARPEAWVTLLGTCGLLLILRWRRVPSATVAFTAGVTIGAAALFHVVGIGWFMGAGLLLALHERGNLWRSRHAYAYAAGFAMALLPFVFWLLATPEHMAAAHHMYGRSAGTSLAAVIAKESHRISDYIGFANPRLHLPVRLPLRLHIVLAIAAAFTVLWRRKPSVCATLAIMAVPHLIWFLKLPNATPRYCAALAPIFGLALALAVCSLAQPRWYRAGMAVLALCAVSQMVGTGLVLNQARSADYVSVATKLRAAIPPGHSCYAAMTFAFALHDYECHSYDRTPFSYTAEVQKPEYMVLGDRVMMSGSGLGDDNFQEVREQAFAFAERHGRLLSRIDDPFYGHLSIYRIAY